MKPLLVLILCMSVLPSCATVYRGLGIAPASDIDDVRAETKRLVLVATDSLGDAVDGHQTGQDAKDKVRSEIKSADDDWTRRPEPPKAPWVEIASAVMLAALGVYSHTSNRREIRETDKWVEEIEQKSQPRA